MNVSETAKKLHSLFQQILS